MTKVKDTNGNDITPFFNGPAAPFAFADQELDFLIQQCRESTEGKANPRSIYSDITPSIMLGVKKLHDDVQLPEYATDGSNCFDIRAYGETGYDENGNAVISTGLSFEIPPQHCLMVYSRSGQGFNHDVRLSNATGVIDSDYRGEIKVKLTADSEKGQSYLDNIQHGDRIAQAMLIPVPHVTMVEVKELSETARGTGGFNSTGIK